MVYFVIADPIAIEINILWFQRNVAASDASQQKSYHEEIDVKHLFHRYPLILRNYLLSCSCNDDDESRADQILSPTLCRRQNLGIHDIQSAANKIP